MLDLGELAARVVVDDSAMPAGMGRAHRRWQQFNTQTENEAANTGARAGERMSSGFGSRLRTGLGRVSSSVSSTLGGTLAVFGRFGAAGAAAMGAVGAAGLGMGLKIAAGNENAQIAFSTMLKSGSKAKDFLDDLKTFASETPFEFPELQTAASSLISAGVQAKNVIPIMTSLGNATSGMGTGSEGIKRATVALQQMNAAGKITAEDLNQLRDAGIPVYDLLASATGKSKKEIAALAATGKLGRKELDQLMSALANGKGLERFNGLMEKQSASLSGMWSTVKDNLGQGLASAVAPVIPLLKDGLGGAANFIERSLKRVPPVLKGVTAGIRGLWDLLANGDYTGNLAKAFGWEEDSHAVDALLDLRDGFVQLRRETRAWWKATRSAEAKPFMEALRSIGDSLYQLSPFADNAKNATFGLSSVFPFLTKVVHAAVRGVEYLATGLRWLADHQGEIADKFRGGWSTVAEALQPVGAAIKAAWDQVRSIDGATVSRAMDTVSGAIRQLGPLISDFATSLPALEPTLHATGQAMKFVADHVDLVGKALPYLIAGFAAYKAAQAANNMVGRDSLIGFGLQLASTVALTIANFRLAASQSAVSASERVATGSRVWSTAVTVASTVAQKVAMVATRAWAATQWLLNAALTANPIGIVVVAIAALVGGLIYAYRHSEKFRHVVQVVFGWIKENVPKALWAAWQGIKDAWGAITGAFTAAVDWVKGTWKKHWRGILSVLTGPIGAAVIAIVTHWDSIKGAFGGARDWVKGTWRKTWGGVSGVMSGAVKSGRNRIGELWDDTKQHFSAAWSWVKRVFRIMWAGLKLILTNPVQAGRNIIDNLLGPDSGVRHLFDSVVRWVRGAFRRSWNGLKTLLTDPVQAGRNAIANIFGEDNKSGLRGKFSAFVRAAGTIWNGLKAVMKAPIVGVIKIINAGLIGAFNWVADKLGMKSLHIDDIKIKGFRKGGATGSGRDDEIAGPVHRNEHVATADEVRRSGGHSTWEKARLLARQGRLQSVVNGLFPRSTPETIRPTDDPLTEPTVTLPMPSRIPGVPGDIRKIASEGAGGAAGEGASAGGAVSRGMSMIGQMGWYRRCLAFVNRAWAFSVARFRMATARASQNAGPRTMSGRPPGGAGVYWDTGPSGHIALAVGDGTVISNDIVKAGRLDRVPQSRINRWGPYRGWWHPGGAKGGPGGSAFDAGGDTVSVKASWLGAFANPVAFLRDRISTAMDKAGLAGMSRTGWAGLVRGMPGRLVTAALDKIKGVASSAWHTMKAVGGAIADVATTGTNRARGLALMLKAGFGPGQFSPLNKLWTRESGWRTRAENPSSHAYGIPQALPGSKMGSVAGDWRTNPNTQIRWGLGYIKSRYGSPSNAWAHSQRTGWYADGIGSAPPGFAWTGEKAAELVLNPQLRKYSGGEKVLNPRDTQKVLSGAGGGERPYIGSVTLVSSGNVHQDLDEVMFRVRTTARGGVYAGR